MNTKRNLTVLSALTLALALATAHAAAPTKSRVTSAARTTGVTELNVRSSGGYLTITGKIRELPFVVRYPRNWNGGAVLFARGYVTPGTPERFSADADPSNGLLPAAFKQGYATAYSAFGKSGYAVENGMEATMRLKRFLDMTGTTKSFITGASMGGNIAVALVEKYPNAFVGALPYCGVVAGWAAEVRYLTDVRVVYDFFTKKTRYALPGAGQVLTPNPALTVEAVQAAVSGLFQAAARDSRGAEARAIGAVASVTGTSPDPVSFITALAGSAYGLQDYLTTTGGNAYDNTERTYASPLLDAATQQALNEGVERLTGKPSAALYLDRWFTPRGRFTAKVLSLHNTVDPLVPYFHQVEYRRTVEAAGNLANLVQQTVQAKPVNMADLKSSGPAHCFFTPQQLSFAWDQLRLWVEQDVRPQDGRDITKP